MGARCQRGAEASRARVKKCALRHARGYGIIPQLGIDYLHTAGMGSGKMGRVLFRGLIAILFAVALSPAAHAQAPKPTVPVPAKPTKATTALPAKSAKAPKSVAAPAAREEPATYSVAFDKTITLHADRTAESLSTTRIKILGESAIRSIGQQTVSYVEGMQTLE